MSRRVRGVGEFDGLRLALARKLVRWHVDCIWAESEPGRGAMFCFMLASFA